MAIIRNYALASKECAKKVMIEVYRSCVGVSEEELNSLFAIAIKDQENRNRGPLEYLIQSREHIQRQTQVVESIVIPSKAQLESDYEGTIKRCKADIEMMKSLYDEMKSMSRVIPGLLNTMIRKVNELLPICGESIECFSDDDVKRLEGTEIVICKSWVVFAIDSKWSNSSVL